MKLLFTSDVHGLLPVYRRFARVLRRGDWDAGVISGDLRDAQVPPAELAQLFGLGPDEMLDELPPADESIEETMDRALEAMRDPDGATMKALRLKEDEIKRILDSAGKPVFVVRGNHDETAWHSEGRVLNVEGCRFEIGRWNVVGCRGFLREEPGGKNGEVRRLRRLVDGCTVLVSHVPARGTLDGNSEGDPVGSRELRALVKARQPRVHLHGHIHGGFGIAGRSANGSWPQGRRFIGVDLSSGRMVVLPGGRAPREGRRGA